MTHVRGEPPVEQVDAHVNDPRFVQYYAEESTSDRALERAQGIMKAVLRERARAGQPTENLRVADVGCNAGTQSRCWLKGGHRVNGLDISRDLVELARARSAEYGERAVFEVGTATSLPWASGSMDVCLMPELLEHVDDWSACITEGARILALGGTLYISTTNVLCPVQQEFTLPGYSWYPAAAKRHFLRLSRTTRPQYANFATYPAAHWFSPYGLKRSLESRGISARDRFDVMDLEGRSRLAQRVVRAIRAVAPLRFVAHLCTPYTVLVGQRVR